MRKSLLEINFKARRVISICWILRNKFDFIFEIKLLREFHFEAQIITGLKLFLDFEVDDQKNFLKIKDY